MENAIEFIQTNRGGESLVVDQQYKFRFHKLQGEKRFWKCVKEIRRSNTKFATSWYYYAIHSQGLYLYSKVGMGLGCGTAYVVVISRHLVLAGGTTIGYNYTVFSISKGGVGVPPHIIIRSF